jgi:hypothetical protein
MGYAVKLKGAVAKSRSRNTRSAKSTEEAQRIFDDLLETVIALLLFAPPFCAF